MLLLGRRNNEFYSEDPTDLDMSDRDFEKFMKTVTDIKVDMMTILADSFIHREQASPSWVRQVLADS